MISAQKLLDLVDSGTLVFDPFFRENIKGCAIKLHLGEWYQVPQGASIDLDMLASLPAPIRIEASELRLLPNQFVLARTMESVSMPDGYMGRLETSGGAANVGLQAHLCDGHVDTGFNGNLWVQLKNQSDHPLVLRHGTYIVKMYIHELTN